MTEIESSLKYNREMLITLGLLIGCDYDSKGVNGCGKNTACKFLNEIIELNEKTIEPINLIQRLRNWSINKDKLGFKYESKVKTLALKKLNFPNENIIDEFMIYSNITENSLGKNLKIKWNRPKLNSFQV